MRRALYVGAAYAAALAACGHGPLDQLIDAAPVTDGAAAEAGAAILRDAAGAVDTGGAVETGAKFDAPPSPADTRAGHDGPGTPPRSVLFLVRATGQASNAELLVVPVLGDAGYRVTMLAATRLASVDPMDYGTILISDHVEADTAVISLRDLPVPIVAAHFQEWIALGMIDAGMASGGLGTAIAITMPSHPLAAGFPAGVLKVFQGTNGWIVVGPRTLPAAEVVATGVGAPAAVAVFAYRSGAVMPGRRAAAARVGLGLGLNASREQLSDPGVALIKTAIDWAYARP